MCQGGIIPWGEGFPLLRIEGDEGDERADVRGEIQKGAAIWV